ncbi:hypothetical protein Pla100_05120 [Neorhodopirellula pilleata]|uniref:Uncharacterized protein n=1 Tax=Neorhodopirellula pilleata TaxID=2714738 RepID=A0A5C6AZN9_9BACT|nr:hypothetical protein Pla100_05120 [Neorhodopirellula pilleata]
MVGCTSLPHPIPECFDYLRRTDSERDPRLLFLPLGRSLHQELDLQSRVSTIPR